LFDTLGRVVDPSVLAQILETRAAQTWTALPGIVRSYDAATQLASVQPAVQDFETGEDGERTDKTLPVIPDVPVAWPGGSGQYFHPGLTAGDEVLLVFSSLDPSVWHRTGSVSKAADLGRHVPAHAFAVPCVYSRGNGPGATPGMRIQAAEVNYQVNPLNMHAVAMAERLDGVIKLLCNWVFTPSDGGAALQAAAKIAFPGYVGAPGAVPLPASPSETTTALPALKVGKT
jgi:hypothetical protein